jgi:VCBS repeat-containing protein
MSGQFEHHDAKPAVIAEGHLWIADPEDYEAGWLAVSEWQPTCSRLLDAQDHRMAAQYTAALVAESLYSERDHPKHQTFVVESPDGTRHTVTVETILEPSFYGHAVLLKAAA